jgi:hypothetical protein
MADLRTAMLVDPEILLFPALWKAIPQVDTPSSQEGAAFLA